MKCALLAVSFSSWNALSPHASLLICFQRLPNTFGCTKLCDIVAVKMAAPEEGVIVDREGDAKDPSLLCTTCQENEWKYKCPGCSARSCSLECVKRHKVCA